MVNTLTSRLGLNRWSASTDALRRTQLDGDNAALEANAAMFVQGTAATRPAASKVGRFHVATDTGAVSYDTGTAWVPITPVDANPPGTIHPYAGATAPNGYLLAQGQTLVRADYAALFAALGGAASPYGLPDGLTFKVPDLRGRTIVGVDTTQTEFDAVGEKGGEKAHVLTVAELPGHAHGLRLSSQEVAGFGLYSGTTGKGFTERAVIQGGSDGATSDSTGSTGAGAAHNNMPPYAALHYIIKT